MNVIILESQLEGDIMVSHFFLKAMTNSKVLFGTF